MKRGVPARPLIDRVTENIAVDPVTGCWLWTKATTPNGYARIGSGGHGSPINVLVHHWIFELVFGPLPKGLEPDHLCRVRHCVNPYHMEPVTRLENFLRGVHPNAVAHRNGTCRRGHPGREFVRRRSTGKVVYCKACRRERRAELHPISSLARV